MDAQLTGEYERTFGTRTCSTCCTGYEQRQTTFDGISAQRSGAYNNDLQLPGNGDAAFQCTGGNASETRLVRQFARLNYAGTTGTSPSSTSATTARRGSARTASTARSRRRRSPGACRTSRCFRNHLGPVNDLKLRGSWGRLGNDRIDDYLFQQTFNINSGNYVFNNELASGATPGRLANPDIGWETTEQTNVGLDIELFSNRLTFTGDVYNKLTSGILIAVPVSSLIGYTAPTQNAGAVQNTGWETALNWRHNIGQFNYSLGFNVANNKNRITSLPGGDQISSPYIRRLGEPIDAIFGIEAVGIFQTQAEVAAWAAQNAKTVAG